MIDHAEAPQQYQTSRTATHAARVLTPHPGKSEDPEGHQYLRKKVLTASPQALQGFALTGRGANASVPARGGIAKEVFRADGASVPSTR